GSLYVGGSLIASSEEATYEAGDNIEITEDNSIRLTDDVSIVGTVYFNGISEVSTNQILYYDASTNEISHNVLNFSNLNDTPTDLEASYDVVVNSDGTGLTIEPQLWEESNDEVSLADPSHNIIFYNYIELEADAGEAVFADKDVTSSSAEGTEESYTLNLDASSYFKIYGKSSGTGHLQEDAGAASLKYFYIGDPASDPSSNSCFRMYVKDASDAMIVERRKIDGTWIESGIFE
ncbi:MAG: hypothetical protein ACOC22_00700, partial [bacterium]